MTIIAAWYDGMTGTAAVGSDTLHNDGTVKFHGTGKVLRIGRAAIGACGPGVWFRFLNDAAREVGDRDGHVLACWLADEWRRWAKERDHGYEDDGLHMLPGGMLLATTEGIFALTSDGGVFRHGRYAAIGSGAASATGAFHVLDTASWEPAHGPTCRTAVVRAVQAAIEHAEGCGGEPIVLTVPGEE